MIIFKVIKAMEKIGKRSGACLTLLRLPFLLWLEQNPLPSHRLKRLGKFHLFEPKRQVLLPD